MLATTETAPAYFIVQILISFQNVPNMEAKICSKTKFYQKSLRTVVADINAEKTTLMWYGQCPE